MKTLIIVVLFVILLAMPAFAYDWVTNPANGHRYTSWLVDGTGWQGAENRAITLGGHLATINNLAENEWVRSTFAPFEFCWIGLYETDYTSRKWAWASSEPLDFVYWGFGEPSGPGAEHWTTICNISTPQGSWADLSSDWIGLTHIAVTEVVPEPLSLIVLCGGIATFGFMKLVPVNSKRR